LKQEAEELDTLNSLPQRVCSAELLKCCGSARWAERMAAQRPFDGINSMLESADKIWWELDAEDWLEAFSHHPKIGEKKAAVVQSTEAARWSEQEQSGASTVAEETRAELLALNHAYEERFGFIFIVCATGRTSEELLALLKERLHNDTETELGIAAEEQRRITHLRLRKLLEQ
jgi:OHCU decarboxylase